MKVVQIAFQILKCILLINIFPRIFQEVSKNILNFIDCLMIDIFGLKLWLLIIWMMMIIDLWLYDYYIILIICIIWLELIMCFYFSLCNNISRWNIPDRKIKVKIFKRFMEFWYSLVIGMKSDTKQLQYLFY